MKVLVTGGLGYIGSHTVIQLLSNSHDVVIIDNLYNSSLEVLGRLEKISGKKIQFYNYDAKDYEKCKKLFMYHNFECVIHFAGYKAVGESVKHPGKYYDNNINSTLNILRLMNEFSVAKMVFSSSATVYGTPKACPIEEEFPTRATNPYGRTKLFIEAILKDYHISNPKMSISILRYFNPIGAHKSGLIGENPNGIPNNLLPYICKVASGELECLNVFGDDYNTIDGTGVRDYIHVDDLAFGHIKAMEYIQDRKGCFVHNLGTGQGYSVLEVVKTFEEVSSQKIKYIITDRRPGDIATCYASSEKANKELNWKATRGLEEMLSDAWNFERKHKK